MQSVVLDTNILVSGLLSPQSSSGQILIALREGALNCLFNRAILSEYTEVLSRPKFSFSPSEVAELVAAITDYGIYVDETQSVFPMPDESDRVFTMSQKPRLLI